LFKIARIISAVKVQGVNKYFREKLFSKREWLIVSCVEKTFVSSVMLHIKTTLVKSGKHRNNLVIRICKNWG
jgi:hypothetical protein